MATKIIVLNQLVVQYDDAVFTDTFDANVGGTQPGEIKKISDNSIYIKYYDNGVVKIEKNVGAIAGTLVAIGNMTKITVT